MALSAKPILAALMPLRLARAPLLTARSLPVAIAVRLAAGLTHREFRFFAFRYVPFGARERRPNQPAMHRSVIVQPGIVLLWLRWGIGVRRCCRIGREQIGGSHIGGGVGLRLDW
jgi:hypothetical protein